MTRPRYGGVFHSLDVTAALGLPRAVFGSLDMARIAIVTGGTRGIGRAICERLQADGFTVIANYAGNDAAADQ